MSDHSKDNIIAKLAIASGADIIEKHIALKSHPESLDYNFSIKGKEIRKFRNDIDLAYKLMGKNIFYRSKEELKIESLEDRFIFQKISRKAKNLQ